MTGEQVRWGLENLDLTADAHQGARLRGMMRPIKVSCADHEGTRLARVQQWDGKEWKVISDWLHGRRCRSSSRWSRTSAAKYAAEKKITPRDCSKES